MEEALDGIQEAKGYHSMARETAATEAGIKPLLLYPSGEAQPLESWAAARTAQQTEGKKRVLILVDGTWTQAHGFFCVGEDSSRGAPR